MLLFAGHVDLAWCCQRCREVALGDPVRESSRIDGRGQRDNQEEDDPTFTRNRESYVLPNDPVEESVVINESSMPADGRTTYELMDSSSLREKPLLVDSTGFSYTLKVLMLRLVIYWYLV